MRFLMLGLMAMLMASANAAPVAKTEKAVFAGGCFWCIEADFEKLPGVLTAVSGYTGGEEKNPTYDQVSARLTGHTEAVELTYDPAKVSYPELVEYFWKHIDPTVKDQQFCDHGPQYRTGIYPVGSAQLKAAEASKANLVASARFKNVFTEIVPDTVFWPAEEYHQDYYKKNSWRYHYYRTGCGRDARVKELWGENG